MPVTTRAAQSNLPSETALTSQFISANTVSNNPQITLNTRGTSHQLLPVTVVTVDELHEVTYDYRMSTATMGNREAQTQYDPEDIRVGQTLQALMFRSEETPEGFIIRRKINHSELAGSIRLPGKPNGVNRSYISQLCTGAKHMNNEMLYAIARYLNINPVAIKRPDPEHATLFTVSA